MRHACQVCACRPLPMHACLHIACSAAADDGQVACNGFLVVIVLHVWVCDVFTRPVLYKTSPGSWPLNTVSVRTTGEQPWSPLRDAVKRRVPNPSHAVTPPFIVSVSFFNKYGSHITGGI